jgi:large repetitive protein
MVRFAWVVVAGCGRIGFDPAATSTEDSAVVDAPGLLPAPLVALDMNDVAGSQLTDRSGNGHHAICTQCPTFGVTGIGGTAAQFDGVDDFARIPYQPDLDVAAITLSFWTQKVADTGDHAMMVHRQFGDATADAVYLSYDAGTTDYEWHARTQSGIAEVNGTVSNPDLGRWVHLVGTFDGGLLRLYRDEIEIGSSPLAGPLIFDGSDILIGAAENGAPLFVQEFAAVVLDDIRIYSVVLDEVQRAALAADRR